MYDTSNYQDDEHHPVLWFRGHPVYAAHLIVAVYTATLIVTAILMLFKSQFVFDWLPFLSSAVLRGEVWRILTYGLVNPPSLPIAIDLLMIAWFGREVERYLGRRKFLWLYAGIYLVTPLLFTLLGPWLPTMRLGETGALAVFVAFATISPEAPMMFNLLAKWAAVILVGIFTLIAMAARDTAGLISLWATSGLAWWYIGVHKGRFSLPSFTLFRRGPKLRVLPDLPASERASPYTAKESAQSEMDALLDKIAHSGMNSLTAKERARLDSLRESLLRK